MIGVDHVTVQVVRDALEVADEAAPEALKRQTGARTKPSPFSRRAREERVAIFLAELRRQGFEVRRR